MKKLITILLVMLIIGAYHTVRASDSDLSDWAFSSNGAFSDQGVVNGQRVVFMQFPTQTGQYGQLSKTVTGLLNGSYTFQVSVAVPYQGVSSYNADNIQLIFNDNIVEQWNMTANTSTDYGHTFSVQANVTNNQANIALKINAQPLGGFNSRNYYFYNFSSTFNNTIPVISTPSLPNSEVGVAYSQTLTAINGATPYTWNIISGSLPPGLFLSSTGVISGAPTSTGTFNFTIRVTDVNQQTNDVSFTLTITPGPSINSTLPLSSEWNSAYSQTLTAVNGATPYTWSVVSGSLPTGLNLSSATGEISGVPTVLGIFSFTIRVTDTNQQAGDKSFTSIIATPLSDWAFSSNGAFSDQGVVNGQRVVFMQFPTQTGQYGQLSKTVTGLLNGSYTFQVSVAVPYQGVSSYNADNIQLIFNDNIVEQWNMTANTSTDYGHTFSVQANVTNNQANIALKINAQPLGGFNSRNYYFYNFSSTFNGNTPAGSNIQVTSGNTTLTFSNVTQIGQTTVATSSTGFQPPSGFKLGNPPTYYNISTTALFTGQVEVCLTWQEGQFNKESNLKLFHFNGTNWVNITESGYPDTVNNRICGLTTSFSDFAVFERKQVFATIDIKPGSYPNTINLGSNGVVPVAIFSTPTFDATTIDPATVTLASAPVNLKSNGTLQFSFQDVNNDGWLDLVVQVSTQALQLSSIDQTADLAGQTFDNTEVIGSDTVRVVQ